MCVKKMRRGDIKLLRTRARQAARLLGAMSNPRRLIVLCELGHGERSVGALSRMAGLSQSALSQHLAKLRAQGLVRTRRDAQTVYYRLTSPTASAVIATLIAQFCLPARGNRQKRKDV